MIQGAKISELEHFTTLHRAIQQKLLSQLPPSARAEYRFRSIGRIADILLPCHNLVFEIQCSSIDPEELIARINDYGSLGYQVIWLLSDQLYNQERMSHIEYLLETHPHYYCNQQYLYDQWQMVHRGRRQRGPALPIDAAHPIFRPPETMRLRALSQRSQWPLHFVGDLADRLTRGELDLEPLLLAEASPYKRPSPWHRTKSLYKRWLHRQLAALSTRD